MILQITDYNNAGRILSSRFSNEWTELQQVLASLKLHLKKSDQAGIEGSPIFDPVGTNEAIKSSLQAKRWVNNCQVPSQFDFLGKDIDFAKSGVLVEVQFSNYPFLLNNLLRSELFFRSQTAFSREPVAVTVIIAKAKMFPASNSTLYYEQAVNQLNSLSQHGVFSVPIRMIGLFEIENGVADVMWTQYSASRYSRTVAQRVPKQCRISRDGARCSLRII